MSQEARPGLGRRAASAAGRGGKHTANWIGKHIIAPATIVIVLCLVGYYVVTGKFPWTAAIDPSKVTLSKTEIDDEQLACGLRMGWEDGKTDDERLFALIAGLNRSKTMKTGLCDVARNFWTLRAEDHPTSWYRPWSEVDKITSEWTKAQLAQFNKLKEDYENYLRDPTTLQKQYPWLECVFALQRTTYPWATPWPDKQLDTTARLVHRTASGAKYFCRR